MDGADSWNFVSNQARGEPSSIDHDSPAYLSVSDLLGHLEGQFKSFRLSSTRNAALHNPIIVILQQGLDLLPERPAFVICAESDQSFKTFHLSRIVTLYNGILPCQSNLSCQRCQERPPLYIKRAAGRQISDFL